MSQETTTSAPRMWSRASPSRVVETAMIGDGPHVRRPRHNNPNQPNPTAADQRPRASTSRRSKFLRKMSLQRTLAFCNRIRSFGGPASRLGYLLPSDFGMRRELRSDIRWPMIENWFEFPTCNDEIDVDCGELHESRLFTDQRHWGRAQLYFQHYLGQRHRHLHNPRSCSVKFDLSPGNMRPIYHVLCGMGLKETLRLAFNEMLHLH
ncbi:uncharacterized protein LOC6553288 [Drosophila erecta]|uniref:GG25215 n=1 Tax=Drosophila erecta TaxID=7220 RepID=B3P2W7_DROER|nr:uncharacterized protein LOC6553288 [Drosophila erecta]EDV48139.1 uncharacterized protein Dere_GG25215 [Drosophila erecta]